MIFTTIYYYSERNCERLGIIYDLVWLWNKYTFIIYYYYNRGLRNVPTPPPFPPSPGVYKLGTTLM
jgi:hypothetical protein